MEKQSIAYWTDDLKGVSVFDVIKQEVEADPDTLIRIKLYLRELEEEIETND